MKPRRLTRHAPSGCPTPRPCRFMIPLRRSCGDASRQSRLHREQDPRSGHCKGLLRSDGRTASFEGRSVFGTSNPLARRTCPSGFFRRRRWEQSHRQPRVPTSGWSGVGQVAKFADFPACPLLQCHFAFSFEIRRVGCRKATFFALKGEMPIRFVRCSLIPVCERGAVSGARYDRRWRANGLPCDRFGARRPWRTLSGPVPSPSQPAARPCKRCLTFRGKNLDL
jgi:hypothetical protein